MKKTRRINNRNRRNRRRAILISKICICFLICVGVVFGLKTAAKMFFQEETQITLKPSVIKIREGEKLPEIKAYITVQGENDTVLDKKTGKTVKDLVAELKRGENYTVICKADGKTEGKFPVEIVLKKDIKEKLDNEWEGKVSIQTNKSILLVKNALGDWEGNKFKKVDGQYAKNEFIKMKNGTYYFDEKGEKVTGEKNIGIKHCVFSPDGKLESEKFIGLDPTKPMIALTFDDGPGPEVGRILDVLEKYNARATFFMVGPLVKKYPETVKRISDLNCELGNHSTTHSDLSKLGVAEIRKEIQTTSDAIAKATGGRGPTVMRPPYGAVNPTVKQTVGLPIIMWSVDTLDWKTRNTQKTIDSVMTYAKDGSIVLMHDIHKTSVDAAIQIIPKLIEKGYQLVTVSELAEARGVHLENGVKYSQFSR
ncbi:polysaccharide deacetylase family protein [Faecalimonas sp.]